MKPPRKVPPKAKRRIIYEGVETPILDKILVLMIIVSVIAMILVLIQFGRTLCETL